MRVAALLHDVGHSLHSHASERVYSELGLLKKGADELTSFVGKEKGSGEVISFCLARTKSVASLLKRAAAKVINKDATEEFSGDIDLDNVSLLIVGRSKHPLLQFLGDIISGGFDADKLDYLLRDTAAAGLPLRYDLERYLYTVFLDKDVLADNEGELHKLYTSVGTQEKPKDARPPARPYKYFDTYRLRLPQLAMSTIEQMVICKLMLFSYIYHHQKVRAAEGMLVKLLNGAVAYWQRSGKKDSEILETFLSATDATLDGELFLRCKDSAIARYSYRIANRLIPREVFRLSPSLSHPKEVLVKDFFTLLEDKARRREVIDNLEKDIAENLLKREKQYGKSPQEALWNAGVWVDVPKVPKFEDMSVLVGGGTAQPGVPISDIFRSSQCIHAYQSHRFYMLIYASSGSFEDAAQAARPPLSASIGINDESFFKACLRSRT